MTPPDNAARKDLRSTSDRRQTTRYNASIELQIRLVPDGTPLKGYAIEIGPNGMRINTSMPLAEGAYVHVSFQAASNNTHCEGRIVWTQKTKEEQFESGVDIQKWGGSIPGGDVSNMMKNATPKKDRRRRPR